LLVAVRTLVLRSSVTQSVHEAAGEVTGGSEREEQVTLLALFACTKMVSISYGNQ
jgi:hypothetical protein